MFWSSQKYDPGCTSRIRILIFYQQAAVAATAAAMMAATNQVDTTGVATADRGEKTGNTVQRRNTTHPAASLEDAVSRGVEHPVAVAAAATNGSVWTETQTSPANNFSVV